MMPMSLRSHTVEFHRGLPSPISLARRHGLIEEERYVRRCAYPSVKIATDDVNFNTVPTLRVIYDPGDIMDWKSEV